MKLVIILTGFVFLSTVESKFELFNSRLILNVVKGKVFRVIDKILNGTECGADLNRLITDAFKFKLWALRMLDASGKPNPGLLYGNYHLTGSYDECLSVETEVDARSIQGQYCTIPISFEEDEIKLLFNLAHMIVKQVGGIKSFNLNSFKDMFKMSYGLCIPQSCTPENLNRLWSHLKSKFRIPFRAMFLEDSCFYKEKPVRSNRIDVYVFLYFAIVLTIVLGSTVYDVCLRKLGKEPDIFVSFSLQTNIERLLSTNCENDSLTCLYGIRVLSMTWIIFGHVGVAKLFSSLTNNLYAIEIKQHLESVFLSSAPYAVDTFFSVSGLLVVYVYLKQSEKFKINILTFYVFRVLRLMPALLATILIYISVIKHIGGGPFWSSHLKMFAIECEEYWWSTLFFINNFYSAQCVQHTWYLSVDTQLYAIAPLILWGIKNNPIKTFSCVLAACLFSFIYTYFVVVQNNLGFIPYFELADRKQCSQIYFSTVSRMPSWLIGIFFGYLVYQYNSNVKITRMVNYCLWLIALSTMSALVFYHVVITRDEFDISRSAFFNAFSRAFWSLAVCYVIFSCSTGHGGFVNTFLSHPVFIILGKLTYSMFLIHPALVCLIIANKRQPGYYSNFEAFCEFWGILASTIVCSAIMCLIFETPVISILRHYEKSKPAKEKKL